MRRYPPAWVSRQHVSVRRIESQEPKMFGLRTMVAAIVIALLASTASSPGRAQNKGKDPKSFGGWVADVERPAASTAKTVKAKVGRKAVQSGGGDAFRPRLPGTTKGPKKVD
jgi:hypothetical protein